MIKSIFDPSSWRPVDFLKICVMSTILLCNGLMFLFLISYLHQQQASVPLTPSSSSNALQEARMQLVQAEVKQLREELFSLKQTISDYHHESHKHTSSDPQPVEPAPAVLSGADFVHVKKNLFPFNTSLFDDYTSPIVDPDRQVIFCWMAKNSCSKFKRLFAYAAQGWGPMEKISMIKFDHQIHEHHELFRQLNAYSEKEASEMINNKDWNKVAFVRDPLERWMSAFAEKCRIPKKDPSLNSPCFGKSVTDFVNELHNHFVKVDPCGNKDSDSHFFPQWCECDLWNDHEKWTIYRFDRKNRQGQIDHFLNNFGYENYVPMFQTSTSHRTKANKTELMQQIETNPNTKEQLLTLLKGDYMTFFPDLWPPF